MGLHHHALTLTGVAQRLSDVYGDGVGVADALHDIPLRQITFQTLEAAQGATVYVGSAPTITAADHGFHIDPGVTITLGPFSDAGPMKLGDYYVLGAAQVVLVICEVPY